MKKKLTILAHFTDVGAGILNGRFSYIASNLSDRYDISFITSDFSHTQKIKKDKMDEALPYKVIYVHEPPYQKNVSLKRLHSHKIFGKNVKKVLDSEPAPDLIYCAVPSLDVGKAAADYCNNNDIPFIIDVQDIWPEAFHLIFDIPVISNILFSSMYKVADYIYDSADQIVAVSQTYVDLALTHNRKVAKGYSVYLGTSLSKFDSIATDSKCNKPDGEIWITYIGTLGHSYNIEVIIDALHMCDDDANIKFVVMGDGPLRSRFEEYAESKGVNAEFTGMLPYEDMVSRLACSDIAVNPINKGASQSIINKVGDYAAAGLPVINTQENHEYRDAVEEYNFGINCDNDDIDSIKNAIHTMLNDNNLRATMEKNSRQYAEAMFDRNKTYKVIFDLISSTLKVELI